MALKKLQSEGEAEAGACRFETPKVPSGASCKALCRTVKNGLKVDTPKAVNQVEEQTRTRQKDGLEEQARTR